MKRNKQKIRLCLKKTNQMKFLLAALVVLHLVIGTVEAALCYDDIKLPRTIGPSDNSKKTWMQAMDSSETLDAVFVGGMTESDKLN